MLLPFTHVPIFESFFFIESKIFTSETTEHWTPCSYLTSKKQATVCKYKLNNAALKLYMEAFWDGSSAASVNHWAGGTNTNYCSNWFFNSFSSIAAYTNLA